MTATATASGRPARRDRTRANDEAILDAAVERISARGVDALSMRDVGAAAGLTSGALYARYENPEELVVAVWERRCVEELFALLADGLRLLDVHDPRLQRSVVARLGDPTPALRAAIEILVVARRIDELAELEEDALPALLGEFGRIGLGRPTDETGRALRLGLATTLLGGLLHALVPGVPTVDWDLVLDWYAEAARMPVVAPSGDPLVLTTGELDVATGDPTRDRIVAAVCAVVARSGFQRTTISRIARRAGCGIAAIYDRYPSRSALVADAAEVLLASLDRTAVMRYPQLALGEYDAAAAVLASNISAAGATRRRLRLEIFVAAAHDPQIAAAYVDQERSTLADAHLHLASSGRLADGAPVDTWVHLARIGSRGLALAAELLPDIGEVDLRWLTRPVLGVAYRSLVGSPAPAGSSGA